MTSKTAVAIGGLKTNCEEKTQSSGFDTEPGGGLGYLPCGFLCANSWLGRRAWRQGRSIRIDRCHHSGTRVDSGFGMEAIQHADSSDGGGSCILQRRRVDALSYRRPGSITLHRGVGCSGICSLSVDSTSRIPGDTSKNQLLIAMSLIMTKSIQRATRPIKALEKMSPHLAERANGTRILLILHLPSMCRISHQT